MACTLKFILVHHDEELWQQAGAVSCVPIGIYVDGWSYHSKPESGEHWESSLSLYRGTPVVRLDGLYSLRYLVICKEHLWGILTHLWEPTLIHTVLRKTKLSLKKAPLSRELALKTCAYGEHSTSHVRSCLYSF